MCPGPTSVRRSDIEGRPDAESKSEGASDLFANSYLASRMSSFCAANLRNSPLFRAIRALNLNILDRNLLRSE